MKTFKWTYSGLLLLILLALGCQKENFVLPETAADLKEKEAGFLSFQAYMAGIKALNLADEGFKNSRSFREKAAELEYYADKELAYLEAPGPEKLLLAGNVIQVPADYPTIQTAIDNATDGDLIRVFAGTYPEGVVTTNGLNDLRLLAVGAVILEGSFEVTGDQCLIKGFTIVPSNSIYGIHVPSQFPTINTGHRFIDNTIDFSNNTTADGRGIEINAHDLCLYKNNTVIIKTVYDVNAPLNQAAGLYSIGEGHVFIANHVTILNTDMDDSFGILGGFGNGYTVKRNTVVNSKTAGIYLPYNNHAISKNECSNQLGAGIRTIFGNLIDIQKNTCNNNGTYGIHLWISTTNSTVNDNKCIGNATCDIIADPTGSGNTQMNNTANCISGF